MAEETRPTVRMTRSKVFSRVGELAKPIGISP